MGQKRYSAKFKFNVVLEALRSPEKTDAEVARGMEVHPATLSRWKREFEEKGPEVFGGSEEVKEYEERIGQLFPRAELGREDRARGRPRRRARPESLPGGPRGLQGHLALPDAGRLRQPSERPGTKL